MKNESCPYENVIQSDFIKDNRKIRITFDESYWKKKQILCYCYINLLSIYLSAPAFISRDKNKSVN